MTGVEWAADNKTLFVVSEDAVTKRSDKLWRHVLGSMGFDPVYEEKDELYDLEIEKTRDKQYLLLGMEAKDTTEWRFLRADRPEAGFANLLPRRKNHRYYVGHREGLFYIRSNREGVNFSIFTAPTSDPSEKNWKIWLPHRNDVLLSRLDLFRDFAVSIEIGGSEPSSYLQLSKKVLDTDFSSRAGLLSVSWQQSGVRIPNLSLQLPKLSDAIEHLRLRHRQR